MQCLYCDCYISPYPADGICPNCGAPLPPDDTPKWQPQPQVAPVVQTVVIQQPGIHCCPRCRSQLIHVKKRGFGWGAAILGLLFLPPFGLLFGLIGRNKPVYTCKTCSYRWKR